MQQKKYVLIILLIICSTNFIYTETGENSNDEFLDNFALVGTGNNDDQESISNNTDERKKLVETWYTQFLPIAAIVFGVLILIYMFLLLFIVIKNHGIQTQMFNLLILTLIFISSVFLLIIGYSEAQITPVIGLFGTAIGYIFGKNSSNQNHNVNNNDDDVEKTITKETES
jgi:hypothetical protein